MYIIASTCMTNNPLYANIDFSAMALAHSKQRSELGHAQLFAHLMIGFNGPTVTEFAEELNFESRQPHWPLYIPPTNFRV